MHWFNLMYVYTIYNSYLIRFEFYYNKTQFKQIQANELTNGVINSCFVLLSKDLIRLFACYNDGIINLLEKFFDMNKKNCKEALEIYKKFLERTESVSLFLKVAEVKFFE